MPGQVVVGVDDSDESMAAADWAADEAASAGADLLVVNASLWQEHALVAVVPARDVRKEQAMRLLGAVQARVKERQAGVRTTFQEVEDAPSRVLLAAASDADLLVLGSRALSMGEGFVLGSVGQEVVSRTAGPVVLVRRRYAAGLADGRRVVAGVDVRHEAGELLRFAFDAAARRGVSLHLVTTWHLPSMHHAQTSAAKDHEAALAAAVEPFRDRFPQVNVSLDAVAGRAADHLVSSASGAGLLVIGNRRREGAGAHIGAVTHGAIHHAPCPVAVVPHA